MRTRVISWFFPEETARRLAYTRTILCALLAVRLVTGPFLEVAGQSKTLFRPLSFMKLFDAMPSETVVAVIQVVGIGAALLAAFGVRSRLFLPVALVSALFLRGMITSIGKVMHNDSLLLLVLIPLAFARHSDAKLSPNHPDGLRRSVKYGWPLRVASVTVAGAYFFSGLWKLRNSGLAWAFEDNLRWALYASSDAQPIPNSAALYIAERAELAQLIAGFTLLVEIAFPLALFWATPRVFLVGSALTLHLGIWVTMRLDYSAWVVTALAVFVDWPSLIARLRERLPSGRASPAPG